MRPFADNDTPLQKDFRLMSLAAAFELFTSTALIFSNKKNYRTSLVVALLKYSLISLFLKVYCSNLNFY
jgi:hypothetical protein